MTEAHRELCHALFDAIERGDVEAVDRCFAPDMTMWVNVTGQEITREENLAALKDGAGLHRRRLYNERRINTFADGFVVQYTCEVTAHDGSRHPLQSCLVAEVHEPGALHDPAVGDVETGDHAAAEHQAALRAARATTFATSRRPSSPERSGWNWTPSIRPRSRPPSPHG